MKFNIAFCRQITGKEIVSFSVVVQNVWFQKISIPPPQRELEIPEGWEVQTPKKFQAGGGRGVTHFQMVKSGLDTNFSTY